MSAVIESVPVNPGPFWCMECDSQVLEAQKHVADTKHTVVAYDSLMMKCLGKAMHSTAPAGVDPMRVAMQTERAWVLVRELGDLGRRMLQNRPVPLGDLQDHAVTAHRLMERLSRD